jgi:hypothetical protein
MPVRKTSGCKMITNEDSLTVKDSDVKAAQVTWGRTAKGID